jgi:hypothetical protein
MIGSADKRDIIKTIEVLNNLKDHSVYINQESRSTSFSESQSGRAHDVQKVGYTVIGHDGVKMVSSPGYQT